MYLLDEKEAFQAMALFLNAYYDRGGGGGHLAPLLQEIEFLHDGRTYDPAAWNDWLECVRKIKAESQAVEPDC
jgi:hypothetical protein